MPADSTVRWLRTALTSPTAVAFWAVALDLLLFSTSVFGSASAWQQAVTGMLSVAAFVALWLRLRAPVAALAATTAVAVTGSLLGPFRGTLAVCVAQARLVAWGRAKVVAAASGLAVIAAVGWTVGELRSGHRTGPQAIGLLVGYLVAPAFATVIGVWQRNARERVEALELRRAEAAREAVAAERGRVARELHDIVAHSVTVMVLQTAGARQLLAAPGAGPEVEELLTGVQRSGEQAMGELRRLLGALDGAPGGAADPPATPGPGLADLHGLLETVRRGGIQVSLRQDGEPGDLDPSVSLAAYRVVQEALTNVGKHAGPGTTAEVRLTWRAGELQVQVTDDGRGGSSRHRLSTGRGLLGLAERVALVGGSLARGPVPEGGYRLTAELPAGTRGAAG